MESLRTARQSKLAPPPSAFAEVVRRMGVVPPGAMLARWQEVATSAQAGGATTLFYSGGWRGVAAFFVRGGEGARCLGGG